jgi:hypothetical protein
MTKVHRMTSSRIPVTTTVQRAVEALKLFMGHKFTERFFLLIVELQGQPSGDRTAREALLVSRQQPYHVSISLFTMILASQIRTP